MLDCVRALLDSGAHSCQNARRVHHSVWYVRASPCLLLLSHARYGAQDSWLACGALPAGAAAGRRFVALMHQCALVLQRSDCHLHLPVCLAVSCPLCRSLESCVRWARGVNAFGAATRQWSMARSSTPMDFLPRCAVPVLHPRCARVVSHCAVLHSDCVSALVPLVDVTDCRRSMHRACIVLVSSTASQ